MAGHTRRYLLTTDFSPSLLVLLRNSSSGDWMGCSDWAISTTLCDAVHLCSTLLALVQLVAHALPIVRVLLAVFVRTIKSTLRDLVRASGIDSDWFDRQLVLCLLPLWSTLTTDVHHRLVCYFRMKVIQWCSRLVMTCNWTSLGQTTNAILLIY